VIAPAVARATVDQICRSVVVNSFPYGTVAHRRSDGPQAGRLGDDDRTSALLILASSVDPNLASTCDRVVLSSTDPQPHDQAQRHSEGGRGGRRIGVVSCGWSLGWRHADRDQFGPRIRLR
jgi:hypothetical protein